MQVSNAAPSSGRLAYWRLKLEAMGWLLAGQPARAEALFGQRQMCIRDRASRAHVRAQAGRHHQALDDARALVAAHPRRSAGDWFNLAYLLEQVQQPAEAEAAFREALSLDPQLDRAWYGLGLALIRQQRFDDAIAALKRNTELQPMSPYGWYQLALSLIHISEPTRPY